MLFGCVFFYALFAPIKSVAGGRIAGGRVRQHQLHDAHNGDEVTWNKDQSFICVQKWEKTSRRFVGKFCLADTESVLKGVQMVKDVQRGGKDTPMLRFAEDISQCESASAPHQLQICSLKGKEDIRVAYSERVYAPKSCFRECGKECAFDDQEVNVLTAAVTGRTCTMMKTLSPHIQKVFARRIGSTTVTTTTTSTQASEAPATIEKPPMTTTTVLRDLSEVSEEDIINALVEKDGEFERLPSVIDLDPEQLEHDDAIEGQLQVDRSDLGKELNDEVVGRIRNVRDFWRQREGELQAKRERSRRAQRTRAPHPNV